MTSELLLAHVLGWDRIRVIAHPDDRLVPDTMEAFTTLIWRRARGEPHQYLTGEQEFLGLKFLVTPAVLIPRPETEVLVERAIEMAESVPGTVVRFADIGTGSGCIAVSLACRVKRAVGWGVDISGEALSVARRNAIRHGVLGRVEVARADLMECFAPSPVFDLILSNPPYVATIDAGSLPVPVREYEPHAALFAGETGLDAYRRLVPAAARRLAGTGRMLLEVGAGMSAAVAAVIQSEGLDVESVHADLQGIPRCLIARRRNG